MKRSTKDHIRTTYTGSLPRPPEMLDTIRAMAGGQHYDTNAYERALTNHVAESVSKQVAAGIDIVADGECSKPSFRLYLAERLDGFESRMPPGGLPVPTGPMGIGGRDATMFPDFYRNVLENNPFKNTVRMPPRVCVGPIRYVGQDKLQRDIRNLKNAMQAAGADEGFMPSSAPDLPNGERILQERRRILRGIWRGHARRMDRDSPRRHPATDRFPEPDQFLGCEEQHDELG